MGKLNQINAVLTGRKEQVKKEQTGLYHLVQKPELFSGFVKTYSPLDEEGDRYPSEKKVVQHKVSDVIKKFTQFTSDLFDLTATQDAANCKAKADIVVDSITVAKDVPVTTLIFLEKQLVDVETFVSKLPTLSEDAEWTYDQNVDLNVTDVEERRSTKKLRECLLKPKQQINILHKQKFMILMTL